VGLPFNTTLKQSRRRFLRRGVTLLELLLVMVLIAVIAAVSYPTASAGLDSLRLRLRWTALTAFNK
jgi:prepilin-type N-terminal cleavage/methylation domain-containing protein